MIVTHVKGSRATGYIYTVDVGGKLFFTGHSWYYYSAVAKAWLVSKYAKITRG